MDEKSSSKTPNVIQGFLKTPSGSSLPGIQVNIYDPISNTTVHTTTDASGYYIYNDILPQGRAYIISFDDPTNHFLLPRYSVGLTGEPLEASEVQSLNDSDQHLPNFIGGFIDLGGLMGIMGYNHKEYSKALQSKMLERYINHALTTTTNTNDPALPPNIENIDIAALATRFGLDSQETAILKDTLKTVMQQRYEQKQQLHDDILQQRKLGNNLDEQVQSIDYNSSFPTNDLTEEMQKKIYDSLQKEPAELIGSIKKASEKALDGQLYEAARISATAVSSTNLPPTPPSTTTSNNSPSAQSSTVTSEEQQPAQLSNPPSIPTNSATPTATSTSDMDGSSNRMIDENLNRFESIENNRRIAFDEELRQREKRIEKEIDEINTVIKAKERNLETFSNSEQRKRATFDQELEKAKRNGVKKEIIERQIVNEQQRRRMADREKNEMQRSISARKRDRDRRISETRARLNQIKSEEAQKRKNFESTQNERRRASQTIPSTPPTPSIKTTPPATTNQQSINATSPATPSQPSIPITPPPQQKKPPQPVEQLQQQEEEQQQTLDLPTRTEQFPYQEPRVIDNINKVLNSTRNAYQIPARASTFIKLFARFAPAAGSVGLGCGCLMAIIAVIGILIFLLLIANKNNQSNPSLPTPNEQIKINKSVSNATANKDDEIQYIISVSYPKEGEITVSDSIPDGTTLITTNDKKPEPEPTIDGKVLTWKLKIKDSTQAEQIRFWVKINVDNVTIRNTATANVVATQSATTAPTGDVILPNSKAISQYVKESSRVAGIPAPFLFAIAAQESDVLTWKDTDEDYKQIITTPHWWYGKRNNQSELKDNDLLIRKGFGYNTCQYITGCGKGSDVRGVIQIEKDSWPFAKEPADQEGIVNSSRLIVRENIYAAGRIVINKISQWNLQDDMGLQAGLSDWSERQVKALARAYCGKDPRTNSRSDACDPKGSTMMYEDIVWEKYNYYKKNLDTISAGEL